MAKINRAGLEKEIAYKAGDQFKNFAKAEIQRILSQAQRRLIDEFSQHPVTQEIRGGSSAGNLSNTLGGNGNLFTFLGFSAGSDPIAPIMSMLIGSIKITSLRKVRNKLMVRVRFTVPTVAEVEEVSPLPWAAGASWVAAIERGISNLGHYLYKPHSAAKSRSGGAIQVKGEVRTASSSSPVSYVTTMIGDILRGIERELKKL